MGMGRSKERESEEFERKGWSLEEDRKGERERGGRMKTKVEFKSTPHVATWDLFSTPLLLL